MNWVPENASLVEAVGKQWSWSYRYPGADGILGTVDIRHVDSNNPFGMNPDDPNGQDDVLVTGPEIHLPLGNPVKVLLRSQDVLHDFYVPQIRAKMDLVPGMITYFWFTPTRAGKYDVLCAELCGSGHYNMRSFMVLEDESDFNSWLATQPTFAETQSIKIAATRSPIEQGEQIAESQGCMGCHSVDGAPGVGPTWKGLAGRTESLADGSTVVIDDAYLIESIVQPNATIVAGYPAIMPAYQLDEAQLSALVAYLNSL